MGDIKLKDLVASNRAKSDVSPALERAACCPAPYILDILQNLIFEHLNLPSPNSAAIFNYHLYINYPQSYISSSLHSLF